MSTDQFKNRLKDKLKVLGITQDELAKKAELHSAAISHFTSGRRTPGMTNLVKICMALNCSADELLGINLKNNIKNNNMKIKKKVAELSALVND